jgi:hypothetical protein
MLLVGSDMLKCRGSIQHPKTGLGVVVFLRDEGDLARYGVRAVPSLEEQHKRHMYYITGMLELCCGGFFVAFCMRELDLSVLDYAHSPLSAVACSCLVVGLWRPYLGPELNESLASFGAETVHRRPRTSQGRNSTASAPCCPKRCGP